VLFRGSSRFESLILSHHPRCTCECNKEEINDDDDDASQVLKDSSERADRNVKRFRGGLVFKAYRRVYHSTLGWRVIKKKMDYASPLAARVFGPCT